MIYGISGVTPFITISVPYSVYSIGGYGTYQNVITLASKSVYIQIYCHLNSPPVKNVLFFMFFHLNV